MIIYDCMFIPLDLLELPDSLLLTTMMWTMRIYWAISIIVTFRTGFLHHHGTMEGDPMIVAKMYMRTWFPLDLLIVVIDWFEILELSESFRSFAVLRFARATRLFSLHRGV